MKEIAIPKTNGSRDVASETGTPTSSAPEELVAAKDKEERAKRRSERQSKRRARNVAAQSAPTPISVSEISPPSLSVDPETDDAPPKKKRRSAKQKERQEARRRKSGGNAADKVIQSGLPNPVVRLSDAPKRSASWGSRLLFVLLVIAPTCISAWYYATLATPQYVSETRFAVRGTQASPLSQLGLTALPGSSAQGRDAYIVAEYIRSPQVISDLKKRGTDLRKFFSRPQIDDLYRIDPDIPLETFIDYWNWMTDVEFNATTSITTFQVNAFSGEAAQEIAAAVMDAAGKLVNDLSSDARRQLIATAQSEVKRTEERLSTARSLLTEFRNKEQSLDPKLQASTNQNLVGILQKELIDLKARRSALRATVSVESPSFRVINRQIAAVQSQLDGQRNVVGSGSKPGAGEGPRNLASVLSDYSELTLEEEFAQKSYSAALAALETAQAEARRQDRYFAIVVSPTRPEIAVDPVGWLNTLLVFAAGFVLWLIGYFMLQSVRDHAL